MCIENCLVSLKNAYVCMYIFLLFAKIFVSPLTVIPGRRVIGSSTAGPLDLNLCIGRLINMQYMSVIESNRNEEIAVGTLYMTFIVSDFPPPIQYMVAISHCIVLAILSLFAVRSQDPY
jgi:hypothetical protein